MAKPISVDLRERVCEAVSEGLSRHQAAARFKVSASSAIRWQAQKQASGTVAPARVGGDRRSARIEAEAAFILAQIEARPDITLVELQTKLKDRGLSVGIGSLWDRAPWRGVGLVTSSCSPARLAGFIRLPRRAA